MKSLGQAAICHVPNHYITPPPSKSHRCWGSEQTCSRLYCVYFAVRSCQ